MDKKHLKNLLQQVKDGTLEIGNALDELTMLPYEDLGFAKVDHHRSIRKGFPEVIFGKGKTPEHIRKIAQSLARNNATVMVTKTVREVFDLMNEDHEIIEFHPHSGLILINPPKQPSLPGKVAIISAGTSDQPITEEATLTAKAMGCDVETIQDIGVAGIHRMLDHAELLQSATLVIVVAGMDGALPSAVAGLISAPVVAVPTSTGYGASFGGLSALLAMLNSCASGVTVVNIDNGFGAGYFAGLMMKKI